MRRLLVIGTYLSLAALLLTSTPSRRSLADETFSSSAPESRWGKDYLPNLPVIDQDGNTFHFYDDLIKGKKVIVNFIFTSCTDICPLTTARMALLQEKLGDSVGRDVFMYSITIDPEHDGPKELKRHAEAFHIGPGWRFLTGKPEDIAQIRYKLGERSRTKTEHRHEMLLGNDTTGDWSKDSAYGDLDRVMMNVKALDPNWQFDSKQVAATRGAGESMDVDDKPGQALFIKACSGCHSVGKGDRVGPDLDGVTLRRDHSWLTRFISTPDKVIAGKDPIAMELVQKFPGVQMPSIGLSEQDAGDVIAYLAAQSYSLAATKEAAETGGENAHHHHHDE